MIMRDRTAKYFFDLENILVEIEGY